MLINLATCFLLKIRSSMLIYTESSALPLQKAVTKWICSSLNWAAAVGVGLSGKLSNTVASIKDSKLSTPKIWWNPCTTRHGLFSIGLPVAQCDLVNLTLVGNNLLPRGKPPIALRVVFHQIDSFSLHIAACDFPASLVSIVLQHVAGPFLTIIIWSIASLTGLPKAAAHQ